VLIRSGVANSMAKSKPTPKMKSKKPAAKKAAKPVKKAPAKAGAKGKSAMKAKPKAKPATAKKAPAKKAPAKVAAKKPAAKGFLKKIDDKYYVKDRDTYIFIRIIIASYEINLKEVYEDNLNKLIDFRIFTFTSKNKIYAININRTLLPNSKLLAEGNNTEGQVVSTVKGGYQIRIYDNILGFLPNSFAIRSKPILHEGELVNVTCIKAGNDLDNVVFDLTENLENDINLKIEQENFIASLKPGDKYLGKIKSTQGYGVFICFGLAAGLLHINNIIEEHSKLSKSSKKVFFKMFEQVFHKGQEIEVIVEKNIDNLISLTWDKTLDQNQKLCNDIYDKSKTILS
jgi:ribosomal protein S1